MAMSRVRARNRVARAAGVCLWACSNRGFIEIVEGPKRPVVVRSRLEIAHRTIYAFEGGSHIGSIMPRHWPFRPIGLGRIRKVPAGDTGAVRKLLGN